MKNTWMKKGLVVSVILLFIGIAIAPSINFTVVKASNDNDLVEVTTQACGIKGYGNTTVKLTRQQYQNLEQYLVDFRARLNQTTTREEAVPIFKEAVVELNKYGLLPKGMNVERAQKLVTGQNQNKNMEKLKERLMRNRLLSLDNNSNLLCLIAGETNITAIVGISPVIFLAACLIGNSVGNALYYNFRLHILGFITAEIAWLFLLLGVLGYFFPATIFSLITLGVVINAMGHVSYTPAQGWVVTFGINLAKGWTGSFYGQHFLPF
ncbi:MAG: hypothetical protein MUO73_02635 [Thermoplasmata archaeon]|nr:hypothetical protein [Thermoplasmata archaeon]